MGGGSASKCRFVMPVLKRCTDSKLGKLQVFSLLRLASKEPFCGGELASWKGTDVSLDTRWVTLEGVQGAGLVRVGSKFQLGSVGWVTGLATVGQA